MHGGTAELISGPAALDQVRAPVRELSTPGAAHRLSEDLPQRSSKPDTAPMTTPRGPVAGTARSSAPVVLAVLGTLTGLVVIGVVMSSEWIGLSTSLYALLFLPVALGTAVEVLLRLGGTPAARAAAWTLFGGVVLAMAPLVLYALFAWLFTYPDAEPVSRDWGLVAFISVMAVLSLVYTLVLGVRLTGRGRGRGATVARSALLVVVIALRFGFVASG